MTIVPISPPPGVWKNGTRYQAKGRYSDANLIRWHDNALRPIGGWNRYTDSSDVPIGMLVPDPTIETIRDIFSWRTNTGQGVIAHGSNLRLLSQLLSGVVTDVTPVGLPAGERTGTINEGYGRGFYGAKLYGVPPRVSSNAAADPAARWYFDTWGEDLLALPDWVGTIYRYSLGDLNAVPVLNAPTDVDGFIVTNERILMTIGSTLEPRLVQWSDQEDLTNWDFADVTNQAGQFTLAGTGRLIAIAKMQNLYLIFSETDIYVAQYVGPPFVYTFRRVAENCAPLHPKTIIATEQFVVWMGNRNLWVFNGSTVEPLPCDVIDHIASTLDRNQVSTTVGWVNSRYSELWWHYPSAEENVADPSDYFVYNWVEGHWTIGQLARSAALATGVVNDPVMVDYAGLMYEHELAGVGFTAGHTAYAETGPIEQSNGDSNLAIRRVLMDTTQLGAVSISFTARQYPTGPELSYGPYPYNNPIPVKVSGREVQLRIDGVLNDWEVGVVRADIVPVGRTIR